MDSDVRRYVIVGNGFAGTTAAEQLRKHDPSCEITLFGDEPYTLYNRISLPPMLRKQIPEAKVMIRNRGVARGASHRPAFAHARRADRPAGADRRSRRPVVPVRRAADRHRRPPESERQTRRRRRRQHLSHFSTWTIRARSPNRSTAAKPAVAIGGSFIAYELAEAFASRGLETHWLMRGPRVLHRIIDEVAGELLHEAARSRRRAHALRRRSRRVRSLERRDNEGAHDQAAWRSRRNATRTASDSR